MIGMARFAGLGALALALAACGDSGADEPVPFENGVGDTGWVQSNEDGTLRFERRLNQLTTVVTLSRNSKGPSAYVSATANPCLGGTGEVTRDETFTPETYDDASMLADVSDRLESVIARIDDRCDVPEETARGILEGFGGLFFRAEDERAAIFGG